MESDPNSSHCELSDLYNFSEGDQLAYKCNQVYYNFIVEKVIVKELIPWMPCMRKHAPVIIKEANNKSDKDAAVLFMDHLKDEESEGKYQEFLQALQETENNIIVNALKDGNIETNHNEHIKLMDVFMSKLNRYINPIQMADKMLEKGVISKSTLDRIYKTNQRDPQDALFELVDALPRKHKDWFDLFLEALYSDGKKMLCRDLDEKWVSLKEAKDCSDSYESLDSDKPVLRSSTASPNPVLLPHHVTPGKDESPFKAFQLGNDSPAPQRDLPNDVSLENPRSCQCGRELEIMRNEIQELQHSVKENSKKMDEVLSVLMKFTRERENRVFGNTL